MSKIVRHWEALQEVPQDRGFTISLNSKMTVMVNFMCQLNWPRQAQIADIRLFLDASVRVFLEEIGIWFSTQSKEICLRSVGRCQPTCCGPERNKKVKERMNSFSLLYLESSSFPFLTSVIISAPGSLAFDFGLGVTNLVPPEVKSLDPDWLTSLCFLGFQFKYGRLWDFSASTTMWANSYNKY